MIAQVRPADLANWIAQVSTAAAPAADAAPAVVLDVREPWELQTAGVKVQGFHLLQIPMREVPGRLGELDPNRPVACLCHHGVRSQRVALFLAENGFTQVANIAGGIDAWTRDHDASVPRY